MKYDITIKRVDEDPALDREFIVGEQTMEQVIHACEQGVDQGDGHEVKDL